MTQTRVSVNGRICEGGAPGARAFIVSKGDMRDGPGKSARPHEAVTRFDESRYPKTSSTGL